MILCWSGASSPHVLRLLVCTLVLVLSSVFASFWLLMGREATRRRYGLRQDVAYLRRQDVAAKKAGCRVPVKAGCRAKSRQDVAARLFAHKKTASLLAVSLPGCSQTACDRPAQRRSIHKSGRRDSNPRQPAWKAGTLPD